MSEPSARSGQPLGACLCSYQPGQEAPGAGPQHAHGEAPGMQQERRLESLLAKNILRTSAMHFEEFYREAGLILRRMQ